MALFVTLTGAFLMFVAAFLWWTNDDEHQQELHQLYQKFSHDAAKTTHTIREIVDSPHNNPDEAVFKIDSLKPSAEYLVHLVENNRMISLLESERIPRQLVDLAGIAQSAILLYSTRASQLNVELYYQGGDTAPNVWGSDIEYTRVLSNLIDNGIKYRNPESIQSNVSVNIRPTRKHVILEVGNNGIPIPPEMQERLFDFVSIKNPSTIHIPGTGLGLFVVKRIVEKYKGRLDFHSSPSGTTFVVELPIAKPSRR